MPRLKVESPSQTLTRHIVFLFTLVLIAMHISLSYYYFKAQGSYYRHLVGYLTYVKANVESQYAYRIEVLFQDKLQRKKGDNQSLYRWAGSSQGYYCNGVYQDSKCSSTVTNPISLDRTFARKFYYLPAKLGLESKSISFNIERCPAKGCTPLSTTKPAMPSTFKIVQDATSKKYYVSLNGSIELQDYGIYKLYLGVTEPCENENQNSILPSYLQFLQYNLETSCDRFGVIPNTKILTQDVSAADNPGTFSLNIQEVFQENEMSITMADLQKQFASSTDTAQTINFNLYVLPKTSYSSSITDISTCTVDDDLSRVPSYSNYINTTGLTMFVIKQVFIVFLLPIPLVEMIMGFFKVPEVGIVGIVSKSLLVFNIILVIIEGAVVRYEYFLKTNLVNKIRNLGWKGCFDDTINQKFIRFPSVFHSTQDTYNYYLEVYMWVSAVGLFILALLFVKLGMDMCVKKRKYGEYDADPNQNVQQYPEMNYVAYQENPIDQQYMTYSQQLPPVSLVKTPSNKQKLLNNSNKNNLSTIKEQYNMEVPQKGMNTHSKQIIEMKDLQNSNHDNYSDEESD